jgi:hypothetical protein
MDARRMRDALSSPRLGFEVIYGENLTKQMLERRIGLFADKVQDAEVALVYFAGHGATFGDVPYVVPVDAQFSSLGGIPYELVQVETLIGELRRAKGLRIASWMPAGMTPPRRSSSGWRRAAARSAAGWPGCGTWRG